MVKRRRIYTLALIGVLVVITALIHDSAEAFIGSTWYAQYWNNTQQMGTPTVTRYEETIDYNWGFYSPAPTINDNYFSARWTRAAYFSPGVYRFTAKSDDGIRVSIDNVIVIDNYTAHPVQTEYVDVELSGATYTIQVDYFEWTERAVAGLKWQRISSAGITVSGSAGIGSGDVLTVPVVGVVYLLNVKIAPDPAAIQIVGRVNNLDDVLLTGKRSENGAYVQIALPTGAVGWVPAGFLAVPFPVADLEPQRDDSTEPWGLLPWIPHSAIVDVPSARVYSSLQNYVYAATVYQGEMLELVGYQTYDGNFVLVSLPDGTTGWIYAGSVSGDIPLWNLAVWIGAT